MLQFTCGCGQALKVADDLAGWKTKCPGCKQLISVPGPDDEPAEEIVVERAASQVPWKGIAIGASAVALLAIIVAIASAGGSSPQPTPDATETRYKEKLADRDGEIDRLRAELGKNSSKLAERLKALEEERDQLRRDLAAATARVAEPRRPTDPEKSTPVKATDTEPTKAPEGSGDAEVATLTPEQIQEKYFGAIAVVATADGPSSGFFIHRDGLVVARYSAIAGSESQLVTYVNTAKRKRVELNAEVVAVDQANDLALLKVTVPDLVPIVELETKFAMGGGQELTVIGPSPGSTDFSLLRGKVVDVWAPAQGKAFIEMSIPITPAHAGAPVFNVMGRVVGLAMVPLETTTSAGLAIPAAHVQTLLDHRETKFLVKGPLKDWESKKKNTGGVFNASAEAPPGSIPVDALLTKLLVDEERDRLVGADSRGQGLVVMSISKKKVLRTIKTGPQPTDLFPTGNPDVVWVGHMESGNIVKVELEEGRIFDRVGIPGGYDQFAATRNHLWICARGTSYLMTLKDKQIIPLPFNLGGVGYDRRRDLLVGFGSYQGGTKVIELDPDKVGPILRDIADIKANPSSTSQMRSELKELVSDLESRVKTWPAPLDLSDWHGKGFRSRVCVDRSPRVVINRTVLKRDRPDTIVGTFGREKYTKINDPSVRDSIALFGSEFQPVLAVSLDGRWAATMTHVFDIERVAVQKELPCLSTGVVFSEDSKKLYMFDVRYSAIVAIDVE